MTSLKSHPDLELSEHISQVISAIDSLLDRHSIVTISPEVRSLARKAALLHDSGKGTEPFQEYIKDPPGYSDDPMDKAHTPMSALLSLLLAQANNWNVMDTLLLSAGIFGHHGRLPTVDRLREIGSGTLPRILKYQIPTLQIEELALCCDPKISELDITGRPWAKAQRYLDDTILPAFNNLSINEAIRFRLKTQLIFSFLLEADKAFLAVKDPEKYLQREPKRWQPQWVKKKIGKPENTLTNKIRSSIRAELEERINEIEAPGIFSLTAPTGIGKTLLSATWLLKIRKKIGENTGMYPKVIVVLPFLSVIDQTEKEYQSLLTIGEEKSEGSWLLTSHSLSDRKYGQGLEEEIEHFFVDTWRTELVITTYDQFLMSLMDSKTRHQMRFHNLCDALIVMDEVQSLPCKLWKPLEGVLKGLMKVGNSSILLMSATLPAIIPDSRPIIEKYSPYFEAFNRYKLIFKLDKKRSINDFCNEMANRLEKWLKGNKRVLITLNTRKSARSVRDRLAKCWPSDYPDIPLLFLSADVTPKDRLAAIDIIKNRKSCIVVSTQCIEAGVDIDMGIVIRDFAPLDSIIQISGRCNRNWNILKPAPVEIVDLVNEQGRRYADMIYDDVHLQVTRQLIEDKAELEEREILPLANRYFELLFERTNTGIEHLERFARWQEDDPVQVLLRGTERAKYTFLVLEQDIELKKEMAKANKIEDRWKRREAWRSIAGRIARVSVCVFARPGFDPRDIAAEYLGHWILRDGFYSSECGLLIDNCSSEGIRIL